MRTSLGIASIGLLDRGSDPALSIASTGMLQEDEGVVVPAPTGGGIFDDLRPAKPSMMEQQLREEDDILMMVASAFVEIMQ